MDETITKAIKYLMKSLCDDKRVFFFDETERHYPSISILPPKGRRRPIIVLFENCMISGFAQFSNPEISNYDYRDPQLKSKLSVFIDNELKACYTDE